MNQHKYQIGIAGKPWFNRALFDAELMKRFFELGISTDDYAILEEEELEQRDPKSPFVAVFFGYYAVSGDDHPPLQSIIEDSLPIIPCVVSLEGFRDQVPANLSNYNGLELKTDANIELERAVTCVFENLALLRTDRRIFISYRRADSREIALQLYDAFQARCFDTFLDTHSIQPAVDMQNHLWHRLADSDVVILLDSPGFSTSDWTLLEKARANLTSVQILHLLWPEVDEDPTSALSVFVRLQGSHFSTSINVGQSARLEDSFVEEVCRRAEGLRAHALALRHAYIVDQFCDLCRDFGKTATLHPKQYITVTIDGTEKLFVPAIGVPNAYRINQVEQVIRDFHSQETEVTILYDSRGLLETWVKHIAWLNSHLRVKSLAAIEFSQYFEGIKT